jgi:hypothetical protein
MSGCAKPGPVLPEFDHVVLLSAPPSLMLDGWRRGRPTIQQATGRARARYFQIERWSNRYCGSAPPWNDTSAPLEDVVAAVVRLAKFIDPDTSASLCAKRELRQS